MLDQMIQLRQQLTVTGTSAAHHHCRPSEAQAAAPCICGPHHCDQHCRCAEMNAGSLAHKPESTEASRCSYTAHGGRLHYEVWRYYQNTSKARAWVQQNPEAGYTVLRQQHLLQDNGSSLCYTCPRSSWPRVLPEHCKSLQVEQVLRHV